MSSYSKEEVLEKFQRYLEDDDENRRRFTSLMNNIDKIYQGIRECGYWDENGNFQYGRAHPRVKNIGEKVDFDFDRTAFGKGIKALRDNGYIERFDDSRLDIEGLNIHDFQQILEFLKSNRRKLEDHKRELERSDG